MVYGPIAAWLVELFPTRIRYTSMSLPYHIGNGWFGGFLPTTAFALVATTGNIYQGLWYPIVVAAGDGCGGYAVSAGDAARRCFESRVKRRAAATARSERTESAGEFTELYARYSWALDTGDTDGYVALFTDRCGGDGGEPCRGLEVG